MGTVWGGESRVVDMGRRVIEKQYARWLIREQCVQDWCQQGDE